MADAALSVAPSPLATLLTGAPADSIATGATAHSSDPFAFLLANAAGPKAETKAAATATADAVAALVASAAKAAAPLVTASSVAGATLPTPVEALPADAEAASPITRHAGTEDKEADAKNQSGDPLADAIASGATAVLALAPMMAAPVQPQSTAPAPTPVKIDAPIGMTMTRRLPIAGLPGGGPFKPAPQSAASSDTKLTDTARTNAVSAQAAATAANIAEAAHTSADTDSAQVAANVAKLADTTQKADADAAQADPRTPQPPAIDSRPAMTALSPEMVKAAIAAIGQRDGTTTPANPTTAADATPVAPTPSAQAQAEAQKLSSPVSQQARAEQTASVPAPNRRGSGEVAAPRRTSDTRKRIESAAADAAAAGSSQRAEPAVTFGREAATVQPKGDAVVEHTLTVARDGAWLDTLARDIANSAGNGSDLRFKLDPQNLGSLTVAISQSEDGASIRMTADKDATRNLLLDAQPKLIAEARAQGLKVSDTHVDLRQDQSQNQSASEDASRWAQGNGGQNGAAQNGQNRQSSPDHQPFVSNLGRKTEAESESLEGDSDALYA
jgi:flagellar hook-length control protein FliK